MSPTRRARRSDDRSENRDVGVHTEPGWACLAFRPLRRGNLLQRLIQRGFLRRFLGLSWAAVRTAAQHHDSDRSDFHCTLTLPLPVTRARKSFPLAGFFTRMVLPVTPSDSARSFEQQMRPAGGNFYLDHVSSGDFGSAAELTSKNRGARADRRSGNESHDFIQIPRRTIVQGEGVETLQADLVLANRFTYGEIGQGDHACGGGGDAGARRDAEAAIVSVQHVSAPDHFRLRIGRGGQLQTRARKHDFPLRGGLADSRIEAPCARPRRGHFLHPRNCASLPEFRRL